MGLHQLLQALERNTEGELQALTERATVTAVQIRAAGAEALEGRRATDLAVAERRLHEATATAIATARRTAAALVLSARAHALDRIRARAESLVDGVLPSQLPPGELDRELLATCSYLGPDTVTLRCPDAWQAAIRGSSPPTAQLRCEPTAEIGPGLVGAADDGHLSVDATLRTRLARAWPDLAIRLVRELEGGA